LTQENYLNSEPSNIDENPNKINKIKLFIIVTTVVLVGVGI
jgi:hypothetical protein